MSDIEDHDGEFDKAAPKVIQIPYVPRKHFVPVHASTKRFIHLVAHRRCGKSVFEVNHLVRAALRNPRMDPPPRYGYVGPSFAQAKDLVWGYLKHYTSVIPGMEWSESDLQAKFPNGARISLYGGATSHERMRGLYFDGIAMDEYPLLHPDALDSVIRPALSDYEGFGIFSGTSNGADHFYKLRRYAENNRDEWDVFDLKVTETDALKPAEVAAARRMMSPSAFAREYLNSFEAAVEGAYYEEELNAINMEGRICSVPYDPRVQVQVWWDLGVDDAMALWFVQRVGKAIHVIDYYENTGKGLDHYFKVLRGKQYDYGTMVMPHDIRVREMGTARSRLELVQDAKFDVTIAPNHRVEDGIAAVRSVLPICYFDKDRTAPGVACLRAYQTQRVERLGVNKPRPLHNWASHGADAFRTGAMGLERTTGWGGKTTGTLRSMTGALKRRIGGVY